MGPIQRALGVGNVEVEFDGKKFKVTPWNQFMKGELQSYIIKRAWLALKEAEQFMSPEALRETRAALVRDIATGMFNFGSVAFANATTELEPFAYLVFLSLHDNHPELSPQDVMGMVERNMPLWMEEINKANEDPMKPPARPAETTEPTPTSS